MRTLKLYLLKSVLPAFALVFCVLLAVNCRSTVDGIGMLSGDYTSPEIESFCVNDSLSSTIEFSKPVTLDSLFLFTGAAKGSGSGTPASSSAPSSVERHTIEFSDRTVIGESYVLEGRASDEKGNSLTFSIPFTGYNASPAVLCLSEVRNAYATATVKGFKTHRCEFVELYVLEGGNLSGMELYSAGDGNERKYTFPAIDVNKGEYITVHPRRGTTADVVEDGMVSETGDDLTLSVHMDSCDTARDLWSENLKSCYSDSDIIVLKGSSGAVMDALVFAKSTLTEWKEEYAKTVSAVEESGVWLDSEGNKSCSLASAFCSDYITTTAATRSMARQNLESVDPQNICSSKKDWMVVSETTPGTKNSSKEYVK